LNKLLEEREDAESSSAVGVTEPLVFEASSVNIPAGRDLVVPIPLPRQSADKNMPPHANSAFRKFILEWALTGDLAPQIELQLELADGKTNLLLMSRVSDADTSIYLGSHELNIPTSGHAAATAAAAAAAAHHSDLVKLKLRYPAMWGQASISYKISLREDCSQQASSSAAAQSHQQQQAAISEWEVKARKHDIDALLERRERLVRIHDAYGPLRKKWDDFCSTFDDKIVRMTREGHSHDVTAEPTVLHPLPQHFTNNENRLQELLVDYVSARTSAAVDITKKMMSRSHQATISDSTSPRAAGTVKSSSPKNLFLRSQQQPQPSPSNAVPTNGLTINTSKTTDGAAGGFFTDQVETSVETTVFSCESLHLRPSSDFRIPIPPRGVSRPATLRWEFSVPKLINQPKHVIGFAVLEKKSDGSLPQIVPYKCVL
jgi:hypothetical protein